MKKNALIVTFFLATSLLGAAPHAAITSFDNRTHHDLVITIDNNHPHEEEFIKSGILEKVSIPLTFIGNEGMYLLKPIKIESADGSILAQLHGQYDAAASSATFSTRTEYAGGKPQVTHWSKKYSASGTSENTKFLFSVKLQKTNSDYELVIENVEINS